MLTDRQLTILGLIVQVYTTSGVPVGSKTLMSHGVTVSPATIRNDMMALENLGLLEKTHSSSGRVPSIQGYRYYVDHLLKPSKVEKDELLTIKQFFGCEFHAINEIIEQAAKMLSKLTSYTAFSLGPEVSERKLTGFRIVPLNDRRVIGIIVTDKGNVESQVFSLPISMSGEELEKMVQIINDKLVGQDLTTVYYKLRTEIPLLLHKYFQTPANIMGLFDDIFSQIFEEQVYVGGRMNLLDFHILHDINQFKSLYSLLNNKEELTSLLAPLDHDITFRIGSELENSLLKDMSLITASYNIGGHGRGTVALLGPTSMPYSKMFSLLDVFRTELANQLTEYYESLDSPTFS